MSCSLKKADVNRVCAFRKVEDFSEEELNFRNEMLSMIPENLRKFMSYYNTTDFGIAVFEFEDTFSHIKELLLLFKKKDNEVRMTRVQVVNSIHAVAVVDQYIYNNVIQKKKCAKTIALSLFHGRDMGIFAMWDGIICTRKAGEWVHNDTIHVCRSDFLWNLCQYADLITDDYTKAKILQDFTGMRKRRKGGKENEEIIEQILREDLGIRIRDYSEYGSTKNTCYESSWREDDVTE